MPGLICTYVNQCGLSLCCEIIEVKVKDINKNHPQRFCWMPQDPSPDAHLYSGTCFGSAKLDQIHMDLWLVPHIRDCKIHIIALPLYSVFVLY